MLAAAPIFPDPPRLPAEEDGDSADADDAFRLLMDRGDRLRRLRRLALADERARLADEGGEETKKGDILPSPVSCDDVTSLAVASEEARPREEDEVRRLPTGETVLDYGSYLSHQRYFDDLKHDGATHVDFGFVSNVRGEGGGGRLVVEQRKSLGKGGICWDAGFVLGEHVIAREDEWNPPGGRQMPRVVDLGAGTGLTGLMIAKATRSDVTITDLPELRGLMEDNVRRNFGDASDLGDDHDDGTSLPRSHGGLGTAAARVLRWGVEADYAGAPYDVVVGADIVTSLYDPRALAEALHALSGPDTNIYLSGKARLDRPHEEFDAEMRRRFERVEKVRGPVSRLRSPGVFVIVAGGKKVTLDD